MEGHAIYLGGAEAHALEEQLAQAGVGVVQRSGVGIVQPVDGDFVEGSEPGRGDEVGVAGRDGAGLDGAVELAFDQVGELATDEDQVVAEGAARAGDLDEDDAGETERWRTKTSMRPRRAASRRSAGESTSSSLALDGVDQLVGQFAQEGPEDGGFAGEVKVGSALGATGAVDDVVDGGAVVTLFAEDVEGGLQEGATGRALAIGGGSSGEAQAQGCHQTDWSVGLYRRPGRLSSQRGLRN